MSLNTAFFEDGVYLEFGEHAIMEKPLHVLSLSAFHRRKAAVNVRNVIWARRGAQAKLVQTSIQLGDQECFINEVSNLKLDEHAALEHYVLNQSGPSAMMTASCSAVLSKKSRYQVMILSSDMRFLRSELEVSLQGAGAHVDLKGLYLTQGKEHIDQNVLIKHVVPDCTSDQILKGIVDGQSRLVLRGKVHVFQDAQKTAASQTMKTLMLSESAIVDAKPELEIYADDVKCSHGTAIGQIEDDAVFYLQSRGISTPKAKQILTRAFAMQIVETIDLDCVMTAAERALHAHFDHE